MKRSIALLRAVNVGGKNKLAMAALREGFEALGFRDVKTVLNSGNVVFSADEDDPLALAGRIREMLRGRFGMDVPVFVIAQERLAELLRHAPDWWGTEDKAIYDDLIFILPPATVSDVYAGLGEPKAGLERTEDHDGAIFWSFSRKDYQKTNWWPKTAGAPIGESLTIRTANTVRKLVGI